MIKILFLAANPKDTDPLRLGEEVRAIKERLRLADQRDQFVVPLPITPALSLTRQECSLGPPHPG
jgi:hypothetical protein